MDMDLDLDPDNRFHAATVAELDRKLADEGWATGEDVWAVVKDAYTDYLCGDSDLAAAQLASGEAAVMRKLGFRPGV